jgi:hypothetical protein
MKETAFLWAGKFESEKEFWAYANHNKKHCPWEKDYPLGDVIGTYSEAFRAPNQTLRQALVPLFYADGYLDAALAKLKKMKGAADFNAVKSVHMSSTEAKTVNVKAWPKDAPLLLVGQFEFDSKRAKMFHPERRSEPTYAQAGWVSIWIGDAPTTEKIEDYMEEEYNDDVDDDQPLSQFGRDWKLTYDHDYLFHEGYAKPKAVKDLLKGWRAAKSFLNPALAAAEKAKITAGNFIVVAYDLDYSKKAPFYTSDDAGYHRHAGKPSAKSPLKFVGTFEYKE